MQNNVLNNPYLRLKPSFTMALSDPDWILIKNIIGYKSIYYKAGLKSVEQNCLLRLPPINAGSVYLNNCIFDFIHFPVI
jgi:hypothetical protein